LIPAARTPLYIAVAASLTEWLI